uniref:Uncharacterized protein n=1 Tax=Arundo donax TaxID=35708 RepID=A0A0A9DKD6_ARUDO
MSPLTGLVPPALSSAWTSENTTNTRPVTQIATPIYFLNLYLVFKNIQVRKITAGIAQQSRSITLVRDVYS